MPRSPASFVYLGIYCPFFFFSEARHEAGIQGCSYGVRGMRGGKTSEGRGRGEGKEVRKEATKHGKKLRGKG